MLGFPAIISAQQPVLKGDPDLAAKYYSNKNYKAALQVYLLLLKKDAKNVEYNQKAGRCYLLSHSIKAKAIPHLEFVVKQPGAEHDAWLDLARAYHFGLQFDKAIDAYNKYKEKAPKKTPEVDRMIQQCLNGKELVKRKLDITFENMGKTINSPEPDYYPIVTPDGQTLLFTTRRKGPGGPEIDGFYPSDIFIVTQKAGVWGKAANIGGNINTALDEQATDITYDGNTIVFYIDHIEIMGDLHTSKRPNGKGAFLKSQPMNENINSGFETSGSIWTPPDGEGMQVLVFSSSRSDNFGQTDIYMCRQIPAADANGNVTYTWGLPVNLGPNINTKFKEEFPRLSQDGKTLYFASEGHSSMGGFDIFKSVWDEDENAWSKPRNLGYPLNTAEDEMMISFVEGGRIGYMSAMREDGLGDWDIYKVTFNEIEGKETIYRGHVIGDSTLKLRNAIIHVHNKNTGTEYGTYVPEKNKGYYVMALPPGKWVVTIEAEGYKIYEENITLFDFQGFKPEVVRDFYLKK
ncbi:MAG: PD40 domain-containing protein [Bacteroidia bacterium]|nr:PD40 domain-containing protein [Bacteroidia bacterium]